MLFKVKHLEGIRSGKISLAFRVWKKPMVKKRSLIKTVIGQLEIVDITTIELDEIDTASAQVAGYESLAELLKILEKRVGTLYRIEVKYHSPDPRIAMRNKTDLSEEELSILFKKIERLDKYSKTGPWTSMILQGINQNPKLRAVDLATRLGVTKDWLKPSVRKLKNLGLTISHGVGYSLSPLGLKVLDLLESN